MKKRIIYIIFSLLLLTALFSSCGKEIKQEETTAPETTTAAADLTKWNTAYEEYMLSLLTGEENLAGYDYEAEECKFGIVDLNADGTPELLISEGEYDASKVDVYYYDGYEVKLAGSVGVKGEFSYSDENSTVSTYSLVEDSERYQETYTAYLFTGTEVVQQWQGISYTENPKLTPVEIGMDYGEEVTYLSDDTETTYDVYASSYEQYISKNTETFGRNGFSLTQDNIISVCENGQVSAVSQTEVQSEEYTSDIKLSDDVKAAYSTVLYSFYEENTNTAASFSFAYIDNDEIPELLISEGSEHSSRVKIYTFDGTGAVLLCTAGSDGKAGYVKNKGYIISPYSGYGATSITVYKLENGNASSVWEGTEIANDDGSKEYTSNGETITAKEYNEKYDEYISNAVYNTADGQESSKIAGYSFTEENLTSAVGEENAQKSIG